MTGGYKYLTRKPGSVNRQLYVRDRWVAARTLYGARFGDEAMTPEEIAEDFDVPLEAVRESISWCESDPPELRDDFAAEEALDRARKGDSARHAASAGAAVESTDEPA